MAATRRKRPPSPVDYWEKRLRSKEFNAQLSALLADELRSLGGKRFKEVLAADSMRRLIGSRPLPLRHADAWSEALVVAHRRGLKRLTEERRSVRDLVGAPIAAHLEALLTQDPEPSAEMREALDRLVHEEFVSRLLTDLVFTALVEFYQRVNPLFGAFAMRSLEDQIKSFIRGFLPLLQDRITSFVLNRENQRIAHHLSRTIARQVLAEPLSSHAKAITSRQRQEAEALLRTALHGPELDKLGESMALALFDDLYAAVKDEKIGDLIQLREQAKPIAAELAKAIGALVRRDAVLKFLAAEADRAAAAMQADGDTE